MEGMHLFGRKKPTRLVGIDLGTSAVKIIELTRAQDTYTIAHCGYQPLPARTPAKTNGHAVADCSHDSSESKSPTCTTHTEALQRAYTQSGSTARQAVLCLAANQVIVKNLTVPPTLAADDLSAWAEIEAARVFPNGLAEVYYDFVASNASPHSAPVSSSAPTRTAGPEAVELVVCKQQVVAEHIELLATVGLSPCAVEVDRCALRRAVAYSGAPMGPCAVLDMGAATSRLWVLYHHQLLYGRELRLGGDALRARMQPLYAMPPAVAADAQTTPVHWPDEITDAILHPFIADLADEIERALTYFYSSSSHECIDRLLLTGGCARIPTIAAAIETRLLCPTAILNPFGTMRLSAAIDPAQFQPYQPSFVLACGLAMRALA